MEPQQTPEQPTQPQTPIQELQPTIQQLKGTSYRQSINAIIMNYVLYRWILALCTMGVIALLDWLNYRNTKLTPEDKFLTFVTGALVTHSTEVPYEDIMNVKVDQSIIGQFFKYGTVNITMKVSTNSIAFKYVADPETVRTAIQSLYVTSSKFKVS